LTPSGRSSAPPTWTRWPSGKKFGRELRLWGGVDKRELAKDFAAIDAHLRTLQPLVAEGGFIPTVDHLVPPDVSLENFEHYMRRKHQLLRGESF